jgi:hypothetical protein
MAEILVPHGETDCEVFVIRRCHSFHAHGDSPDRGNNGLHHHPENGWRCSGRWCYRCCGRRTYRSGCRRGWRSRRGVGNWRSQLTLSRPGKGRVRLRTSGQSEGCEIIVTLPSSGFIAVYYKRAGHPFLTLHQRTETDDYELLAQVFRAAANKARARLDCVAAALSLPRSLTTFIQEKPRGTNPGLRRVREGNQ